MALLEINDLHVGIEDTEILRGVDLDADGGEVHAVMGPNGSGKSTLAKVLAGREEYEVRQGSVQYDGEDLLEMEAEERAQAGVFMAFQYPVELPGVSQQNFLKESINAVREAQGKEPMGAADFIKRVREKADLVDLDDALTKRSVNEGFSGGEKKRNEIFHLAMLEPRLAVLDETDSGLDIDALRIVADGVNQLRADDRAFVIITHYQRVLEYIEPDYVHAMVGGRIAQSGDKGLAVELEERGYEWLSGSGSASGTTSENGEAAEPEEAAVAR